MGHHILCACERGVRENLVMSSSTVGPDMGMHGIVGNRGPMEGGKDKLLSLLLFSCSVSAHQHPQDKI